MDDALLSFAFPGSNSVYTRKTLQIIYTSKQVNVYSFTSWCKLSSLFSRSAPAERKRTVRKPSSPPALSFKYNRTYHNKTESIAKWNSLFHTYLSASVTCRRAALFPPHRHTQQLSLADRPWCTVYSYCMYTQLLLRHSSLSACTKHRWRHPHFAPSSSPLPRCIQPLPHVSVQSGQMSVG